MSYINTAGGSGGGATSIFGFHKPLTAQTTYNVSSTGSDITGDGSVGNPWATLQHAYNYIAANIDMNGNNIYVQIADAPGFTYQGLSANTTLYNSGASCWIAFRGNPTTPSNVKISQGPVGAHSFGFRGTVVGSGVQMFVNGFRGVPTSGCIVNGDDDATGWFLGDPNSIAAADTGIEIGDIGPGQPFFAGKIQDVGFNGGLDHINIDPSTFTHTAGAFFQMLAHENLTFFNASLNLLGNITFSNAYIYCNEQYAESFSLYEMNLNGHTVTGPGLIMNGPMSFLHSFVTGGITNLPNGFQIIQGTVLDNATGITYNGYKDISDQSFTVANLPSAATAGAGARAFVTNANSTTFLSVVAGGGANKVPVVSDGANWLIG